MKILVAGASGFIGSHIAAALHRQGHHVVAAGRNLAGARRLAPDLDWIGCDFRHDSADDWLPRLAGVEAVINCVGVLQDGLGDNSRAAHVDGANALFTACAAAGVSRVIHISAVGADAASGSAYARDKQDGERALTALDLDWVILRPSLVIGRNAYGGTALIRALCGIPVITPLIGGDQAFRPISTDDVAAAVSAALEPGAPVRVSWDIGGPQRTTMADLVRGYRRWLGFGETRIWRVPRALAVIGFRCGDLLGWMGVRTSMRTTALQQLDYDVEGDPSAWLAATGATPAGFDDYLASAPAGQQDRWQSRLGFARPVARWVLGLYWLATGIISLTIARGDAIHVLQEAGYSEAMQAFLLWFGSAFDIAMGAAMVAKWRVRWISAIMIAGTFAYILALSLTLPGLWADALGPILKVFPMMALALMIAATEDER